MANGNIFTNDGINVMLGRGFNVGSLTTPTLFKIGKGTATPAKTDTDIQTGVNFDGGGSTKSFVSGFPTANKTNRTITIRCVVNTADGNGNTITEMTVLNTDGTALTVSRSVHTGIVKTNTQQIAYILTYKGI